MVDNVVPPNFIHSAEMGIGTDCTTTTMKTSSMDSSFPVFVPEDEALCRDEAGFKLYVRELLRKSARAGAAVTGAQEVLSEMEIGDDFTGVSEPMTDIQLESDEPSEKEAKSRTGSKFMDALLHESGPAADTTDLSASNQMLTENAGVAYRSTNSPLLDLFAELEKTISGPRLRELLEASWKEDALSTLKIVWNARSIHLGKSDKETFYRCLGWIHEEHPETVLVNLPWTFRGVIEKKVRRQDEDEPVMVEEEGLEVTEGHEVRHGVSHGYWKDLLNILVLAVNDEFHVLSDPRAVLNKRNEHQQKKEKTKKLHGRKQTLLNSKQAKAKEKAEETIRSAKIEEAAMFNAKRKEEAKDRKHKEEADRHMRAIKKLEDPFYRALHLTIARLFAEQLRKDMDLLKSGKRKDIDHISLAAKWAPSLEGFHDKHTFITSSIAEILFPRAEIGMDEDTRELYLKRAREQYRHCTLSPLRKALDIVERDITAGTFENIHYEKVPSIAMDNNKDLFVRKDLERFERYIDGVAEGKSRISGAVLLPSTLVHQAREACNTDQGTQRGRGPRREAERMLKEKIFKVQGQVQSKVIDGQWKTLIQRIKDNGKLESSIAVCDVSGSMTYPEFPDGTCPMDTSVGLSLLLAEVTEPPFGGALITFSENPEIQKVGGPEDSRSFKDKVRAILGIHWGGNTNFVAVFEDFILPLAIKNELKQEDMVKQVFVFSDMQFDAAQQRRVESRWETHYERILRKFEDAGYKMPRLIFWNLAGGRAGYTGSGDPVAPKPVTQDVEGTALVAGYSQGQLKMFLEEGQFKDEGMEDEIVDEDMDESTKDDQAAMVEVRKKRSDPMATLRRAISHKAYAMLEVVD